MKQIEFSGVGAAWASRMKLQTSTGVAIINSHDVESVNIEDLNTIEGYDDVGGLTKTDSMVEHPIESQSSAEGGPEYALNVCLRSGKEYEVLLPSRKAADKLLEEIATHLGF